MSELKSSLLITVSIVSHGHGELVDELMLDIKKYCNTSILKIVLTNNIDDSYELRHNAGLDVKYIRNEAPKGFGENHNQAFNLCDTQWFVILNPDIRLKDDVFTSLVNRYQGSDIALVAPVVLNQNEGIEDSVRTNVTFYSLLQRLMGNKKLVSGVSRVARGETSFYWFAGMFLFVRSEEFRSIGGFDQKFFLYCEDYDLCARMYVNGFVMERDSELSVIHDARRDSHRSLKFLTWHITGFLKVWTSSVFWKVLFSQKTS